MLHAVDGHRREDVMATDRIVQFRDGQTPPTREEIEQLLRNFFSSAALDISWSAGRFYVTLVGKSTFALSGLGHTTQEAGLLALRTSPLGCDERWIEVWSEAWGTDPSASSQRAKDICIITRHADEFTSALADGLVSLIARQWKGDVEGTNPYRDMLLSLLIEIESGAEWSKSEVRAAKPPPVGFGAAFHLTNLVRHRLEAAEGAPFMDILALARRREG